jgi:hypothetical protein
MLLIYWHTLSRLGLELGLGLKLSQGLRLGQVKFISRVTLRIRDRVSSVLQRYLNSHQTYVTHILAYLIQVRARVRARVRVSVKIRVRVNTRLRVTIMIRKRVRISGVLYPGKGNVTKSLLKLVLSYFYGVSTVVCCRFPRIVRTLSILGV